MLTIPNPSISSAKIAPTLIPIYSVEDQSIFGYELKENLFLENILNEIDNSFFNLAFSKLAESKFQNNIFINISVEELITDFENSIGLHSKIKKQISDLGLKSENIFLIIHDRNGNQRLDDLLTAVEFAKELGFKIVLDGLGEEAYNLERLAALKPDIIRINISFLNKSNQGREFKSILAYLSDLSLSTGLALFFEGITTESQLHIALNSGTRFLQGNLLGEEIKEYLPLQGNVKIRKELFETFHQYKRKKITEEISFETKLLDSLEATNIIIKKIGSNVLIDAQSIFKISPAIKRVYITEWDGTQVSAYYEREGESGFKENKSSLDKNWSYLPFFYKHVKKAFRNQEQWHMSEPYFDHSLNEKLIVFSKIIEGRLSIFIDIACE